MQIPKAVHDERYRGADVGPPPANAPQLPSLLAQIAEVLSLANSLHSSAYELERSLEEMGGPRGLLMEEEVALDGTPETAARHQDLRMLLSTIILRQEAANQSVIATNNALRSYVGLS